MRKIFVFALLLFFAACNNANEPRYNEPHADEIHIGVAYPIELMDGKTRFRDGLEMALDGINENGGVLGRPLALAFRDDYDDAHTAAQIAAAFYEQNITAVIGHWSSAVCYFVMDVYEENGVVMLTPAATSTMLFRDTQEYIFRMIADNRVFAEAIAEHMCAMGLLRAVIVFSDDEYGTDFAAVLESALAKRDIIVVDRVTSVTPANIRTLTDRWRAFGCDSIIMATWTGIAETIRLIYRAEMDVPVFGADVLTGVPELANYGALYQAGYPINYLAPDFFAAFVEAHGEEPDIFAISGYAALHLLADAIDSAGSTESTAIAGFLLNLENYTSAVGDLTFNPETQEFDGFTVTVERTN